MVTIIILVHNALDYTKHTLVTLKKTLGVKYEVIVLDNGSNYRTRKMLIRLQNKGYIDKLILEKENSFFARGNNTASKLVDEQSKYILLLNSDIEIRDKYWLEILLQYHKKGVTAFGVVESIFPRADGYCFLIDRKLYDKYKLDEKFEWWWSVTKLQGELLKNDYEITAIQNHNEIIFHYGGKSGDAWLKASGMDTEQEEIGNWFCDKKTNIINKVPSKSSQYNMLATTNIKHKINIIRKSIINTFS